MTLEVFNNGRNYTTISSNVLKDKNISAKAKGVFAYMMTLSEDGSLTEMELTNNFSDGRNSIKTALKELEGNGYLVRERIRNADGTLGRSLWTIYDNHSRKREVI